MTYSRSQPDSQPLRVAMQTDSDYRACAVRLKALADPDRLKIVNALFRGDRSVSALVEELKLPMDKVSHHLGVLRAGQIVQTHRQGKYIIYSLLPGIAINPPDSQIKSIDLGCCKLDLVQPDPSSTEGRKKGIAEKRSR